MAERRLNLVDQEQHLTGRVDQSRTRSVFSHQKTGNFFVIQNEMLATDMHRINEEMYQHWLALKDIKVLSMRLDIFPKFRKIYDEMLFNEQLFL